MSFGLLQKFQNCEGHCRVSPKYDDDGITLGRWVMTQREIRDKGKLDPERVKRLDSIGFSWDPFTEDWENGFSALLKFHAREGHCRAPWGLKEDGIALGRWVMTQREFHDKGKLDPERIKRLDLISFSWDPLTEDWENGFSALLKFRCRQGHCRAPQKHIEEGMTLGTWVTTQRVYRNKGKLDSERVKRLDSIGFSWNPFTEDWENGISALLKFHAREGHCRAPGGLKEDGIALGRWVMTQREFRDKGKLDPERIKRLDLIGFSWDPHTDQWEKGFSALQKFHAREGHCRMTRQFVLDGTKLGAWVSKQRQKREKLAPERIKQLNSLGFIWKT